MNILVTGGAGYLGTTVVSQLLAEGHHVRTIDLNELRIGSLQKAEAIREDICKVISNRRFADQLLDHMDCVLHFAAMSSDHAADNRPDFAEDANVRATFRLAEAAKSRGLKFLFSSTSAVYGNCDVEADEETEPNPLTTYAASKLKAEKMILDLKSPTWAPIILRSGTLFGVSPRMRFDLVINRLCLNSIRHGQIEIMGGGTHWRPFMHVTDCARAFVYFSQKSAPAYCCYNIARANLRIVDLIPFIREAEPDTRVIYPDRSIGDCSDYRISTLRIQRDGFSTSISIGAGIRQLFRSIETGDAAIEEDE